MTHCGFEAVSVSGGKYLRLGDFFHQLPHRFFECDYCNSDGPMDNLSAHFTTVLVQPPNKCASVGNVNAKSGSKK